MFVELIESLRCPREHDEAPLVASATRTEARHIVEGILGCPVCGAEFPVTDGVACFGEPAEPTEPESPSAEAAMRLAALLELTDARGFAILCGRWGAQADQIRRLADTALVLVNPPPGFGGEAAGIIRTRDVLPFAASSARAAALDAGMSEALVESAVGAVRAGGRVMGPIALALPVGVTEIVRDDRDWVGEKAGSPDRAPRLIPLARATRQERE